MGVRQVTRSNWSSRIQKFYALLCLKSVLLLSNVSNEWFGKTDSIIFFTHKYVMQLSQKIHFCCWIGFYLFFIFFFLRCLQNLDAQDKYCEVGRGLQYTSGKCYIDLLFIFNNEIHGRKNRG